MEAAPPSVERAAPGVAALFDGLNEDGSHAVLDLGPAVAAHLHLFAAFARQIRFAGLLPQLPPGPARPEAIAALPPHPDHPYDVVLAWDILDRLSPEERPPFIERIAQLTAPGARLYAAVDTSEETTVRPIRYSLLGIDRVTQQAAGPPEPAPNRLLPAQVERLLVPFEVVHAFTLRSGVREYVARRR